MTVRARIALTIFVTGLLTAMAVIATVAVAFQRLERETTFERANNFLGRVVANYDNLLDLHDRYPEDLNALLRNLLLFEVDSQLYLLNADGVVLSSTGSTVLPGGFRVAMGPVLEAARGAHTQVKMAYVIGDDPERMDATAVVAARALARAVIHKPEAAAGYLYLVTHKDATSQGGSAVFRSAFAGPALAAVAGVVTLTTLMSAWIITTVIRPLRRISAEVARATQEGLSAVSVEESVRAFSAEESHILRHRKPDEFDQLRTGFRAMLATLRQQWQALRELDHFRREGVSNLSHDLRSPLTATVACLETLGQRWANDTDGRNFQEDRRLIAMALRNTQNAAQLVCSLGDLAQLDEPEFKLHPETIDLGELLDGVAMRFSERAQQAAIDLRCEHHEGDDPAIADVDIELLERALANLMENALKFTSGGGQIVLSSQCVAAGPTQGKTVELRVADSGCGIAESDIPHLFDRHYQARNTVAPAGSEGGKGLGLAIVKRIAELHHGSVQVLSALDRGTQVIITLPGR